MADRPRRQVRLLPVSPELEEKAGQDWMGPQDEEGLAQVAFLAGVHPSNTAVSLFVQSLYNSAYANTLRGAFQ